MTASTELDRATTALHRQWDVLRPWVERLLADDGVHLASPSVLPGWTVAELVAHLGRAMDALAAVRPAPPGTTPLPLGAYLAGYAPAASDIAEGTRTLATAFGDDLLAGVDGMVRGGLANLERLAPDDGVVLARRGPLTLADMVVTRVIELVVHADDLARSVPGRGTAPIDPAALDVVAQALLDVLTSRGGWTLTVAEPLTWVRLAAGRLPYDVDVLAGALHPSHTAEAVPDLGRELPLL